MLPKNPNITEEEALRLADELFIKNNKKIKVRVVKKPKIISPSKVVKVYAIIAKVKD